MNECFGLVQDRIKLFQTNLIITTIFALNLTHVTFLYTLKIAESTRFSDTFRGYSGTFSKSNVTIMLNVFMSNVS